MDAEIMSVMEGVQPEMELKRIEQLARDAELAQKNLLQLTNGASSSFSTGGYSQSNAPLDLGAGVSGTAPISPPAYYQLIEDDPAAIPANKIVTPAHPVNDVPPELPPVSQNVTKKVVCYSLVICLGSFTCGLVFSYPTTLTSDPNDNPFDFHDDQYSWLSWATELAALGGGLLSGWFMDKVGRKVGLLLTAVPIITGWILILVSTTFPLLTTGRAVTGLGVGFLSVICPVFICEVSPAAIRGRLASCSQLFLCFGVLFTYGFDCFLSWIWVGVFCIVWMLIVAVAGAFISESPRWLYQQGRKVDARDVLMRIRGGATFDVDRELVEYGSCLQGIRDQARLVEFLRPQLWKPLLITLWLMVFQQLSGINVVMFYSIQYAQIARIDIDPNIQSVVLALVEVSGVLLCVAICDLVGRKKMLMFSALIMAASMAGLGTYYYKLAKLGFDSEIVYRLNWLPYTCMILFLFGFYSGFGPLPWVMMAELVPQGAKWFAVGFLSAVYWFLNFGTTKIWVQVSDSLGLDGAYWMCCGFCAVSILFVYFCVPETKGKSLEQIEKSFK